MTPEVKKYEVPALLRQKSTGAMAATALDLLLEEIKFETLKGAFDRFDTNGDGVLSEDEVDAALQSIGVHFTPSQLAAFIAMGSFGGDADYLSEHEFLAMVRRARRNRGNRAGAATAAHAPAAPTTTAAAPRAPPAGGGGSSAADAVDLEERLASVIGLEPIKEKLRSLKDTLVKRRFRQEVGAPLVDMGPLHMLFVGNPGCGKTSVARLLARLLYDLGAVRRPTFVEVQRTDLVGTHIGTTGPKTRAKIDEARGGVLFVDEAYRLTSTSDKDFGTEALEEIMKDMVSGDPVIIAAGYPNDMRRFLEANEGLSRRFGFTFDFPDFNVDELALMTKLKCERAGFELGAGVDADAISALIDAHTDPVKRSAHNGGVAERLARSAMQVQDARLDPTAMKLDEYKRLASMLELADLKQAAEGLAVS